jgi:hypothetical protein
VDRIKQIPVQETDVAGGVEHRRLVYPRAAVLLVELELQPQPPALGFVVLFKLVFAAPVSWRASVRGALRALGATTVLPGGGLIGPTVGAWSAGAERPSASQLTRSTISFVILSNAPARGDRLRVGSGRSCRRDWSRRPARCRCPLDSGRWTAV